MEDNNLDKALLISETAIKHTTLNLLTAKIVAKSAGLNAKDPNVLSYIIGHMYDIETDLRRLNQQRESNKCDKACGCSKSKVEIIND